MHALIKSQIPLQQSLHKVVAVRNFPFVLSALPMATQQPRQQSH